jgi:integrase
MLRGQEEVPVLQLQLVQFSGGRPERVVHRHGLRHTFTSHLRIARKAAHKSGLKVNPSSIVMTMEYYVQDVDENKKKAVEGLDRMMEE